MADRLPRHGRGDKAPLVRCASVGGVTLPRRSALLTGGNHAQAPSLRHQSDLWAKEHTMGTGELVHHRLRGIAQASVVAAVVLSPWLFGSAEPWAYLFICLLVGAGVATWLVSLVSDPHPRLRAPGLTFALMALLAFVFLQMAPLPLSFVRSVSPLSAQVQSARIEAFEEMGAEDFLPAGLEDAAGAATISVSRAATQRSFYLLAAYVGVFVVLANTFTEWGRMRSVAMVVVVSSLVMAVFAIVQEFSGTSGIYWFHTPRFGGDIFGPFTNSNHFAAHMNLAFGAALGLLLASGAVGGSRKARTWREKLVWLSTGRAARATFLGFAAVLMAASVFVSLSRGGIISLAASLAIVGAFVAVRRAVPRAGRVVAVVGLLVLAAVVWLGWRPVVEGLGTLADVVKDPLSNSRAVATRDTLRAFSSSPVLGYGFGSFQHVFPVFQSPSIQFGRWVHAHNDYAQLLAEGGVVGALLAAAAALAFVLTVGRRLRQADSTARLMVGGLSVGLMAIALHSFIDFGLHKPANALLLATLCGMSVAAVHMPTKRKRKRQKRESEQTSRKQAVFETADL